MPFTALFYGSISSFAFYYKGTFSQEINNKLHEENFKQRTLKSLRSFLAFESD
jgi:hypothetical protein